MLPYMRSNVKFEEKIIKAFGGINVTEDSDQGELFEAENMSSKDFPALSVRPVRKIFAKTKGTINGMGTCDGIIYSFHSPDAGHIYLNYAGVDYEFSELSASADFKAKRKFAALSDNILIIPDNVVFWKNSRKFTSICVSQLHSPQTALDKFLKETDGNDLLSRNLITYVAELSHNCIECRYVGYTQGGDRMFYYSSFDTSLKAGDVITVKGEVYSDRGYGTDGYNEYLRKMKTGIECKIKSVETVTHNTPTGEITETVVLNFENHSLDTGGYPDVCFETISIERGIPNLMDICSFNNRVWAISGKQLYASKLSDASEWNDFSSDAYGTLPYASFHTSSQTDGDFTGIISYGNNVYAFKENAIHKIMGNQPDEYTIQTTVARGVGKNMGETLSLCGDLLIYCGSDGVYTYSGDFPKKISQKLMLNPAGISGASGSDVYYVLCENKGGREVLAYDVKRKTWHRQPCESDFSHMASLGGEVYLAGGQRVVKLDSDSSGEDAEKIVRWNFKIRFDGSAFCKKGVGKLMMRYSLEHGAYFTVRACYDDKSRSAVCGARYDEADSGGYTLSMPVKRCRWFVLEFEGAGDFRLKSINQKFYSGSEI